MNPDLEGIQQLRLVIEELCTRAAGLLRPGVTTDDSPSTACAPIGANRFPPFPLRLDRRATKLRTCLTGQFR
ncbi:hypothetical protein [Streptomyces lasiicapitis]|uniref:hypothetical protein n=1 Tax=Streptomyces lasiicapitis TaxID=1923961 RepID=UPI0036588A2E